MHIIVSVLHHAYFYSFYYFIKYKKSQKHMQMYVKCFRQKQNEPLLTFDRNKKYFFWCGVDFFKGVTIHVGICRLCCLINVEFRKENNNNIVKLYGDERKTNFMLIIYAKYSFFNDKVSVVVVFLKKLPTVVLFS